MHVTTENLRNNNSISIFTPAVKNQDVTIKTAKNISKKSTITGPSPETLLLAETAVKTDEDAVKANKAAVKESEKEMQLRQEQIHTVAQQSSLNSLQAMPQYTEAVAAKVQLSKAMLQKAISYQNFKQLENMLAASGDSISVKESEVTKDSYKKLLTIESFDKNGNKHVYSVIVELYQ